MIAILQSERNGKVVAATLVRPDDEIMLITDRGVLVRTRVAEIRELGRATQGVTLIALDNGSKLIGLQRIVENDANGEAAPRTHDRQPRRRADAGRGEPLMKRSDVDGAARGRGAGATRRPRRRRSSSPSCWSLQQPGIEQVSRGLVERPAVQMMQEAGLVLQRQTPPDKREALGKQIEAEVKKYVEESVPLVRERALKIAPTTIGPILEEKFTEDELKTLIAWFENPVNKKYQALGAGNAERLRAEAGHRGAAGGRSEDPGARRGACASSSARRRHSLPRGASASRARAAPKSK